MRNDMSFSSSFEWNFYFIVLKLAMHIHLSKTYPNIWFTNIKVATLDIFLSCLCSLGWVKWSNDQIQDFSLTPISIPDYPNHTQAVARAVRITTEAASKVVGFEQSHGMICQRIKARKLIPKFHSKKDALLSSAWKIIDGSVFIV